MQHAKNYALWAAKGAESPPLDFTGSICEGANTETLQEKRGIMIVVVQC